MLCGAKLEDDKKERGRTGKKKKVHNIYLLILFCHDELFFDSPYTIIIKPINTTGQPKKVNKPGIPCTPTIAPKMDPTNGSSGTPWLTAKIVFLRRLFLDCLGL